MIVEGSRVHNEAIENMLTAILKEFAPMFKIAYAILLNNVLPHKRILIIRFYESSPEERFKLLLDFITLLPLIPLDVYDYTSIPIDLARYVHKYGKAIYVGNYDLYAEDFEKIMSSRISYHEN